MTDEKIDKLATQQADFRVKQSNHKYDHQSCKDSFAEGLHEGLTVYGVEWSVHVYSISIAITISLIVGFLIGLI